MVKLAQTLHQLNRAKILVIGDMMLDSYTIGKVRRVSPEAPVAVMHVQKEERRPGGSGNVVLNLISLGAEVFVVGRVGDDAGGSALVSALKAENVDTRMLVVQEDYMTPVKNRIIADNQQIVRVDHEHIIPLSASLERSIIDHLPHLLEGVAVVAISDYGKGFLTTALLQALIQASRDRSIPVITDPKGHDFKKYRGTTIIKPNLSEAYAAANLPTTASLDEVAPLVLSQCDAELLMVTRSSDGISLFHSTQERFDFPVRIKEVKDVTGAGDTVLAMLAYSIANQLSYEESAQLCNVAAGIAIEHVGCARVTLSDLAHRLFEMSMSNKVFDREHFFVLKELLKTTSFTLLDLSQAKQLTPQLFQEIKQIRKEQETILVYIEEMMENEIFIEMLASLKEISFILLYKDNLQALCACTIPSQHYVFKSDQLVSCIEEAVSLNISC